jgi:protein required for attachment to host cells
MAMRGIGPRVWVGVCDGRKALLLQNAGDRAFPKLETRETYEHASRRTSDIGTSPPGRAFSSAGGGRSAIEATDWHTLEADAFVKDFAKRLDRGATEGWIRELIVVASPRALGVLRGSLGHAAQCIEAEFAKDLVDMPVNEIERHLTHLIHTRQN